MRILVTGCGGLLGSAVTVDARRRGHRVIPLSHEDLDVTSEAGAQRAVDAAHPDVVVHCAAFTAVDRAETEPQLARHINRDGTRTMAAAASRVDADFVYVSTDYVFDGRKRSPYRVDDEPAPLSVYGRTKLEGELEARDAAPGALIVRTSWLYGDGRGFVPAILRRAASGEALNVVSDQRGRPTWAPDAATALLELVEREAEGVFHVADSGDCTWFELARSALEIAGMQAVLNPVSSAEFGAAAPRPGYSVLDLTGTEQLLGRSLPEWRSSLATFLEGSTR